MYLYTGPLPPRLSLATLRGHAVVRSLAAVWGRCGELSLSELTPDALTLRILGSENM